MSAAEQLELSDYEGPSPELKARIRALAEQMLLDAGTHGVGFDEVRQAAETRGWLTGEEKGRFLAFGSKLMQSAGGFVARFRRTRHSKSQRRSVAVYVHKSFQSSISTKVEAAERLRAFIREQLEWTDHIGPRFRDLLADVDLLLAGR